MNDPTRRCHVIDAVIGNFTGLATALKRVLPCGHLPSEQPVPLPQILPGSSISR